MLYRLIELWHRVVAMFRRRRMERDLRDELDFHLAMRENDLAATAGNSREARLAANVWRDVRYALRTLRRAPTFAIVAIGTWRSASEARRRSSA